MTEGITSTAAGARAPRVLAPYTEVGWVSQYPNVPSATMYSLASLTVLLPQLHHHQQVYRSSRLWLPNYHNPIPSTRSEDKHGSSYSHLHLCPCHGALGEGGKAASLLPAEVVHVYLSMIHSIPPITSCLVKSKPMPKIFSFHIPFF